MLEDIKAKKCSICKTIYEEGHDIPKYCQGRGKFLGPKIKPGFMYDLVAGDYPDGEHLIGDYRIILKTSTGGHNRIYFAGQINDLWNSWETHIPEYGLTIKEIEKFSYRRRIRLLDDEEFLRILPKVKGNNEKLFGELNITPYNHHPYFEKSN